MKIGIIKETKTPVDNRVALAPQQVAQLNEKYPQHEIVVQHSNIRAYDDEAYIKAGVKLVDDMSDCDVLFGIKEAKAESLLPGKHYVFFGHIAKKQAYNRPLLQTMINKGITFSDYEYLVDDEGKRVCAFGWWAGVVGVYYTLRGYGLRTGEFALPKPDLKFTLTQLISTLKGIKLPAIKVLVTGGGRVSHGAQHVLDTIGATRLDENAYLSTDSVDTLTYTVADADLLVSRADGGDFSFPHFMAHPGEYVSNFMRWATTTDALICGHFWGPEAPVYLSSEELKCNNLRIKMIGDVTCDIMGSIKSTLRSSTHDDPYYDYNPATCAEEPCFSSPANITVMAVDTCPNALPMDTSAYFGEMLIQHVFEPLLQGTTSNVMKRSTIVKDGKLTERFAYLQDFADGK